MRTMDWKHSELLTNYGLLTNSEPMTKCCELRTAGIGTESSQFALCRSS